jgi:hypothetical protein
MLTFLAHPTLNVLRLSDNDDEVHCKHHYPIMQQLCFGVIVVVDWWTGEWKKGRAKQIF